MSCQPHQSSARHPAWCLESLGAEHSFPAPSEVTQHGGCDCDLLELPTHGPCLLSPPCGRLTPLTLDQMQQLTPMSSPPCELSLSLGGSTNCTINQISHCLKQICGTSASGPTSKGTLAHPGFIHSRFEAFMLSLCITDIWKCEGGLFQITMLPTRRTE